MDAALFLLSRFFWIGLGAGLVWLLRSSVPALPRCRAPEVAFTSTPAPLPEPPRLASAVLARNPFENDGPRAPWEIRPGCPGDAIRERTAYHTRIWLPRELVDRMLEDQAGMMRHARIVPESRNGSVIGVRLLSVPPGGYLQRLGFDSGDVVQTVNGHDVATPDRALEAYAKLRMTSDLVVVVLRGGLPHVLYFAIC